MTLLEKRLDQEIRYLNHIRNKASVNEYFTITGKHERRCLYRIRKFTSILEKRIKPVSDLLVRANDIQKIKQVTKL